MRPANSNQTWLFTMKIVTKTAEDYRFHTNINTFKHLENLLPKSHTKLGWVGVQC